MNFCQSNITSVPQATATHSLRETTLDACALGVELGVFLSLFTLASLLQRQKLLFPVDRQNPPISLRAVTVMATLSAIKHREFGLDLRLAVAISSLLPTATLFSVRQVTCRFSQSKLKSEAAKPLPACACQAVSGRAGPHNSTPYCCLLRTIRSALMYPASTKWTAGSSCLAESF